MPGNIHKTRKAWGVPDRPAAGFALLVGGGTVYITPERRAEMREKHAEMRRMTEQTKPLSMWERYVAEFIQRYSLNAEQSQKAWGILRQCQEKGSEYLSRREDDFASLQRDLDAARTESLPARRQTRRVTQAAGVDFRERTQTAPGADSDA